MLHAVFNHFSDDLLKITKQHFSKKLRNRWERETIHFKWVHRAFYLFYLKPIDTGNIFLLSMKLNVRKGLV
jgi:hypothetical protein